MSTTDIPDPNHLRSLPPSDRSTLLDVFEATVAALGARPALDTPTATLSYDALATEVGAFAERLRERGVGPGDRVGVRVPSGTADLYIAILGVLSAGAAYVPVDADDPVARAEQIFGDAGVCAAVGADLELTWLGEPSGRAGRPGPGDDAWIIFTSGSTGAPKGVAVSHRAAVAFIEGEAALWRVVPEDRVLAGLSVAFDASIEEMWLAWANGAALVPAPRALVRSGVELGPWLAERRVTVISTVPTLAAIWDDAALASVRLLILGGEACPEQLVERLAGSRELWNTYGPTEATVVSTAIRLYPGEPVTIGAPLRGWELTVVDADDRPVADGEAGELVIGGVGLGRYLRADLDAERYRSLPALGWKRAYRTGDIVRRTGHGLEFVGRRDHQVKIGGRRIELGELDDALNATPGVRAACTVVQQSAAGNKLLVGYVAGAVAAEAVRADVAERMPASLVPMIVVLDELPIATSGKVDRKALPWPPPGRERGRRAHRGPEMLAEQWREQLGPVAIGADSDFFALGGTSLAAAKLISVLRVEHPAIAVADVYEYRRLRDFADRLEASRARRRRGRRGLAEGRAQAAAVAAARRGRAVRDPGRAVAAGHAGLRQPRRYRHPARELGRAARGVGAAGQPARARGPAVSRYARPAAWRRARPLFAVLVVDRAAVVHRPARRGHPLRAPRRYAVGGALRAAGGCEGRRRRPPGDRPARRRAADRR